MRMCADNGKTFEEGFAEYILDCKARNLRDGTIAHYQSSIPQIYKRIPADSLISSMDAKTMPNFIIALRDDPNLNEMSTGLLYALLKNVLRSILWASKSNPLLPLLSLIGFLYLLRNYRYCAGYLVAVAASTFTFIYIGGRSYPYYFFAISIFIPLGLIPFTVVLDRLIQTIHSPAISRCIFSGVIALSILTCGLITPNRYLLGVSKEDLPQYQFASIIGTDGSSTVLNYGFLDGGFYTASNTVPNCKVFCLLNINVEQLTQTQDSYVAQGICDYIVTRNEELDVENYSEIASTDFWFEHQVYTYRLYGLR